MKLFKKDSSKKKFKRIASSTYEIIDIVLEDPKGILKSADSGIVGTCIQIQKVSRMIIMVNKDYPGIPIDADLSTMKQYDLMVWDNGKTDVYYVAGSMSNFYTMCLSYTLRHLSWSFTDFVIDALLEANYMCTDKYAYPLFTDKQLAYFDSVKIGEPVITITNKRHDEMMKYIEPRWSIQYDVKPIVISADDPDKATIMSMARFYFIGRDNIIAYVNARQSIAIKTLLEESTNNENNNDMIATEVIEQ